MSTDGTNGLLENPAAEPVKRNMLSSISHKDKQFRPTNIAVDYDETISSNPKAWVAIMELMHKLGMTIYVVTYRYANLMEEFDLEYLKHYDFISKLVFTGRRGKKKFCEELGIHIDIWVDDNPITVTHSMRGIDAGLFYSFTPDEMEIRLVMPANNQEQAQYELDNKDNLH